MQAIMTKYIGPTNTRGARIKATTGSGHASVTVPYDHALPDEAVHWVAARALIVKMGWKGPGNRPWGWVAGGTRDGLAWVPHDRSEGFWTVD